MKNDKKGFTIIELLVVISIIGLLSTISVVALNGARKKSRDAKRVGDMKQIQTSLELYFNDNSAYPVSATALTLGTGTAKVLCDAGFVADIASCPLNKIYQGLVPANPTPNGSAYSYTTDGTGTTFTVTYTLEEATGGIPSGSHSLTPNSMN